MAFSAPAEMFRATLLCREVDRGSTLPRLAILATAIGLAVTGVAGTCSQLRRSLSSEPRATIALECPQGCASPATRIGLAILVLTPTRCRRPLVSVGDLIATVVGFGAARTAVCNAGAGLFFEPSAPVTDVSVSTTLLLV